ncbi:MAG: MFS transporter [Candidatus Dormibacteraeota bacterium]|nr:MFS transporter [Candidatus Dormibacteraeota bacterium]
MAEPRVDRGRLVLVTMTLANAMILVDQTAVPLALPNVMQQFGVGSQAVQWVLNGSLLPLAGLLVLGGRLGDLLGRRRVFLTGALLFSSASAVGGLAPSFGVLLAARVLQGMGGALMLPATVAIVSSAFSRAGRGRALGTMGGIAAVAGALGPTVGGVLTSAISWRSVLLINVPLVVLTVIFTLRSVTPDPRLSGRVDVDLGGALLLCVALVGVVFGLAQTQVWGWSSPGIILAITLGLIAGALFFLRERRVRNPLLSLGLLRHNRNYLGATISQGIGGMAEMGLGLIFPLLLILNLRMPPALAGLALIPTTLPMVILAPLAGRWYDRSGGLPPLLTGFGCLAVSGVLLAVGATSNSYLWMLPGLVLFGVGLAIVLTVNDPVSLDTIPEAHHGQASGVTATAEQGGGAIGIAVLYAVFHSTYLAQLSADISAENLPSLSPESGRALKAALQAAEQTGLNPSTFDSSLAQYLLVARDASDHGYAVTFLAVAFLAIVGCAAAAWLVRKPPEPVAEDDGAAPAAAISPT